MLPSRNFIFPHINLGYNPSRSDFCVWCALCQESLFLLNMQLTQNYH